MHLKSLETLSVTLIGKRIFEGVVKDLRMRHKPGLSWWALITIVNIVIRDTENKTEKRSHREGDVKTEGEMNQCNHKPKNATVTRS